MKRHYFLFTVLSIFFFITNIEAQCLSGNCINGEGIYKFPSGSQYIGSFVKGEINGYGSCYYIDGSRYSGNWKNRFPHGDGNYVYANGTEVVGFFKRGELIYQNGDPEFTPKGKLVTQKDIQTGCIYGNCEDGAGIMTYIDGTKYVGDFVNGKKNGHGSFYYFNGDVFLGDFVNDFEHGKGTLYAENGDIKVGHWFNGEYVGDKFEEKSAIGCVEGNCVNGIGTLIYRNQVAKYIGKFENKMPNGFGSIYYKNGDMYKGNFKNGKFDGEGTFQLFSTNKKYPGIWTQGKYLGLKPTEEVITKISSQNSLNIQAVIIGVSSYKHMPALRFTDNDAFRMFAFLQSPEGGALKEDQISLLIDEDATLENIRRAITNKSIDAGPNDLLLIYFSGHGVEGAFLPIDFDGFENKFEYEELKKLLDKSRAKYKICFADACHSGSFASVKSGAAGYQLKDYYTSLSKAKPGTAILMSSKSEETSLESNGLRQGVFSHFLIKGLGGKADANQDRFVDFNEISNYVIENVSAYTGNNQTPVVMGTFDGNMTISALRR